MSEQPYETLGSIGTGLPTTPTLLATGGLRTSTIYQAGVQLTRCRCAIAWLQAMLRVTSFSYAQVQARTEKLSAQIREQVETSVVALETAQADVSRGKGEPRVSGQAARRGEGQAECGAVD